ncbi:uncharacterized protein DFL_009335 [Arthrobotrys flagrans]|uniref:Uncharacterized protein n=1 Tax=Arthrobotrys flagrans TaxID=97331 RepID=A0A436ZRD5_ARTFL|nr:hypothetical protein DFL_009335 [Arthrobotrys flagrans]
MSGKTFEELLAIERAKSTKPSFFDVDSSSFEFKAPKASSNSQVNINNRSKVAPSKPIKPSTNTNASGSKVPGLAFENPYATGLPPWKNTENLPRTGSSQSDFRVDLLTANLQYLNKIYENYVSAQNWTVAHQCLLKAIEIMKRKSRNGTFPTIRDSAGMATFSDMLNQLQIKLFSSHLRLGEYEEAWKLLPTLGFNNKSHPTLWQIAYRELLTTAGCLDRAFNTPIGSSEGLDVDFEKLIDQAEISCRKAIDAAIDGKVDIYDRPAKYQLYATMAVIKYEHLDLEEAVFWKTLVVADEVDIEKNSASFPLPARWMEKYNSVKDVTLQSPPLAVTSKVEEVRQELDPKLGGKTDNQSEGPKVEFSGDISKLREELKWNLNEIKATLKQGLQDIKSGCLEVEELKDELKELKEEWEVDVDILRDEMDELRDEFGDRLLEELQDRLDPELSVGQRLESVRIANGRIAEMNKEVKEKLDELEAELTPSKQQNEPSEIEPLGLD